MSDIQIILTPIPQVALIMSPLPIVVLNFTPTSIYGPFQPFIHVVNALPGSLIEDDFYIILN